MKSDVHKILRKFALILLLVYVTGCLKGQTLPDERVLVKTDRQIYMCGEKIYFSAYTYEDNLFIPLTFSSILYTELYNQDNLVISVAKVILKKGTGTGSIDVPRNVTTGVYYLRAYTNYMKNFGIQQFYLKKLKLVNPFNNSGSYNIIKDDRSATTSQADQINKPGGIISPGAHYTKPVRTYNIKLLPDKRIYKNREKVKVSVTATDKNGFPLKTGLTMLAVLSENDTVRNQYLPDLFQLAASSAIPEKKDLVSIKYQPEIYGDIISGKVIFNDGRPAKGIQLQQSFIGQAGCIESTKTGNDGSFYFLAENEKNKDELILRISNQENKFVLIPDNEFFDFFPPVQKETFNLNQDEADLVAKQFINIQVEDAFSKSAVKKENISESGQVPFYGKEYSEYKFSDYAKLPNMREFIFEVILGVVALKENRKDNIAILDANSNSALGTDPLMMIDGVPVADASIVLGIDPEKVKSVRVVRSKYFYKKQIFDGIFDILTYAGDARSITLPDNTFRYGFVHAGEWENVVEPVFSQKDEGTVPVYKNLLYWNSGIETNSDGNAEVTFYAPDNSGIFIIECFGFTQDGMAGEERCLIKVGEN